MVWPPRRHLFDLVKATELAWMSEARDRSKWRYLWQVLSSSGRLSSEINMANGIQTPDYKFEILYFISLQQ